MAQNKCGYLSKVILEIWMCSWHQILLCWSHFQIPTHWNGFHI